MKNKRDPDATHRRHPTHNETACGKGGYCRPMTYCSLMVRDVRWYFDVPRNPAQLEDFCEECYQLSEEEATRGAFKPYDKGVRW